MIRPISELDQAIKDSANTKYPTPEQIEHWVLYDAEQFFRANPWCERVHLSWVNGLVCTSALWAKPYNEIVGFLEGRFGRILYETEYYMCMLYLWKHVSPERLYVPFKQSPQYREAILGETIRSSGMRLVKQVKQVKRVKQGNIKVKGV